MGVLGPVFRAYDPEQGRLVAIKLFRIDLPPERAHQLVAEFEKLIAADLTHPGIAAPIAAGLSDVSPFLAQDFVTADSLDTVVRLGPSSVTDVTRVASQLGSALAVGSALDIAHGALHPRDVLMSADDVRVTGLGITQALERIGFAAPTRRPYTAPERLAGARWNRRADVFSLAALVYELLSGRRVPGAGDLPADALSDVNGIDRSGVRRVLSRALAEDPDDRFDTALAFADALQDACGKKMKATARPAKSPKVDPDPALDEPWHFEETSASELPLLSDAILTADAPAKDVPVGRGPLPDDDLALPVGDAQPTGADLQISAEADDDGLALTAPDTSHGSMFKVVAAPGLSLASSEDDAIRPVVAAEVRTAPPGSFLATAAESTPDEEGDSETSSSSIRPLMLALVVGVAIGFGIAMLLIAPQRSASRAAADAAAAATERPREFTERAVPSEEPKTIGVDAPPSSAVKPGAPPQNQPASVPPTVSEPVAAARSATPAAAVPAAPNPAAPRAQAPVERVEKPPVPAPKPPSAEKTPEKAPPKPREAAPPPQKPAAAAAAAPARPAAAPKPGAPAPAPPSPAKTGPGSLVIDSHPSGVNVFLDGKLVGTTPLVMESVPLGDHAIHLERAGYQRWASSVRITAGERTRVAASLEYQ